MGGVGEYSLAAQAGPGLQDLPLVLGDPESQAEGKREICKKLFSLCFILYDLRL